MPISSTNKKHLVIVESPAKAKTIKQYLGSDYQVLSSFGHIRDLPKKGLNIDIKKDFKPTYEINPDKKKVVSELKKAAKVADDIWLASDEDREGEAIAWHLSVALGLNPEKTKRIVFHEITKSAIDRAISNPRNVDMHLVDAQQARRILDRLVGYELSPLLWKKVRPGLSAGRVQSVVVRLIVEREREIKNFEGESSYKVSAIFNAKSEELPAQLSRSLSDQVSAREFLDSTKDATFSVKNIEQKPGSRSPGPPFTTSTLQQEAARRLGFSVRQTMSVAQKLYENGQITYMRTDSNTLSDFALESAHSYIEKNLGANYYKRRQFKTKSQSAQEAHEAIRPTDFNNVNPKADPSQLKLYKLIWQRTLASQMAEAQVERTEVTIDISTSPEVFVAKGEVLKFDGFLKILGTAKDDQLLPSLSVGERLIAKSISARESFSRPPARYSEGSLVKKLEELGIGRPSTYAPTISVVQTRGYIEKKDLEGVDREVHSLTLENGSIKEETETEKTGADRNKLIPSAVAEITNDFLYKYFKNIVDYDFTARVESDFDKIAEGDDKWVEMIKAFYKDFHPLVVKSEDVSRQEVSQARLLGNDPKTGKPILARFGRYGPMLQRGETESEEKPDFAPLPDGVELDAITLEQALPMFALPRKVGTTEKGEEIVANIGRFGPYIKVDKLFVSIKDYDPFKITQDEARKLYSEKLEQVANKYIKEFKGNLKIANGPYGPYVTDGKNNARIAKGVDPTLIDEAEAKRLLSEKPAKKRFSRRKK